MAHDPWDELGIRGRSLPLSTGRPPRISPRSHGDISRSNRRNAPTDRGRRPRLPREPWFSPSPWGWHPRRVPGVCSYVCLCACESPRTRARTGERRTLHPVCGRILSLRPRGIGVRPGSLHGSRRGRRRIFGLEISVGFAYNCEVRMHVTAAKREEVKMHVAPRSRRRPPTAAGRRRACAGACVRVRGSACADAHAPQRHGARRRGLAIEGRTPPHASPRTERRARAHA